MAARIRLQKDDTIARIVGGWPWRFDTTRARGLGLTSPATIDDLVAEYVADYPDAVAL